MSKSKEKEKKCPEASFSMSISVYSKYYLLGTEESVKPLLSESMSTINFQKHMYPQ